MAIRKVWNGRLRSWRNYTAHQRGAVRYLRDDSTYVFAVEITGGTKTELGRSVEIKIENAAIARSLAEQLNSWAQQKEKEKTG